MSSLITMIRFCLSTLERMCCHGNIKHFFLLKFCTEVPLQKFVKIDEKQCHSGVILSWMAPFRISAVTSMCCHGNMSNQILLKFGTKVRLSISNKIAITVLEDSISPKHSSKVLPWQQQRIHTQNFNFKQIPIYFQEKSPNLVELSFSFLSYGQKTSRVVPYTPSPRAGKG